ncbi:uncharacterized protein HKW66_Vig0242230 [Vigna angularis]|uniref:Uncharacterized protein n=1 Tax=Phaseolus angularis TaxID=3914 RepID=A0A8T0JNV0_PHAAN|nr:uncharacterized protein HKW66_Vig0242230 [Vigna angularis]
MLISPVTSLSRYARVSKLYIRVMLTNAIAAYYDDLAELEWLSKFAEESFSSEDLQKLQLISGAGVQKETASKTRDPNPALFNPQVSVRGRRGVSGLVDHHAIGPLDWLSSLRTRCLRSLLIQTAVRRSPRGGGM